MTENVEPVKEPENKISDIKEVLASPTSLVYPVEAPDYMGHLEIVTSLNPVVTHRPFEFVRKYERLRAAFLKYNAHDHDCIAWSVASGCNCGLDELLKEYET